MPSFESRGLKLDIHRVWEKTDLPEEAEHGLVVLGGPMGAYETQATFPTVQKEISLIQSALSQGKPVLGICLGSQLLAKAAGASVYKGKNGPEIGWYPVRRTPESSQDPVFRDFPQEQHVLHWHGDTFDLPTGAHHLASSSRYPHQAFRVGPNAYGLQFHVEVTVEMVREWLEYYAMDFTPKGGTLDPAPVVNSLESHAGRLELHAAALLGRLAELFI
jgi:GMP synthase (glutamine-hydrolysing)